MFEYIWLYYYILSYSYLILYLTLIRLYLAILCHTWSYLAWIITNHDHDNVPKLPEILIALNLRSKLILFELPREGEISCARSRKKCPGKSREIPPKINYELIRDICGWIPAWDGKLTRNVQKRAKATCKSERHALEWFSRLCTVVSTVSLSNRRYLYHHVAAWSNWIREIRRVKWEASVALMYDKSRGYRADNYTRYTLAPWIKARSSLSSRNIRHACRRMISRWVYIHQRNIRTILSSYDVGHRYYRERNIHRSWRMRRRSASFRVSHFRYSIPRV